MQVVAPNQDGRVDSLLLQGTLLVTNTLNVMAGVIIAPALPAMARFFIDVPNAGFLVRLVLTLPALCIAFGAPLAGAIIDRFGRKGLLAASVALYGVAGGAGVIVSSLFLLLVSRAVLGLTVAGIQTCVMTLAADYYCGQQRARLIGLLTAFGALGGTVFLSLGGFLAEISWRSPFFLYLVSFVVLPFIIIVLYEPPQRRAHAKGAGDESADVPFPLGLVTFIYVTIVLIQAAFYMIPVQLPFYLESMLAASASQSGLAIAGIMLCYAIVSASFGWIRRRLGRVSILIIGAALTSVGYILIGMAAGWTLVISGLILSGAGLGLNVPNLNVWLADEVPEALRGRLLGGFTTSFFIGHFVSPFISQPLAEWAGMSGMYWITGLALLALVGPLFISRHRIGRLGAGPVPAALS